MMIGILVDAGFDEDSAARVASHVIDEHDSEDEEVWVLIGLGAGPEVAHAVCLAYERASVGGPRIWPRERSRTQVGAMPRR